MAKTTDHKLTRVEAAADDPIYSRGWTIGSATPSKRSTKTTGIEEATCSPDAKTPPQDQPENKPSDDSQ